MVRHRSYLSLAHSHFYLPHTHSDPPLRPCNGTPVAMQTNTMKLYLLFYLMFLLVSPAGAGNVAARQSNGVIFASDVSIYRPVPRKLPPSHFLVVGLICFPFVWELIISAMVATWNIWLGINGCLLSFPTSETQIRKDLP